MTTGLREWLGLVVFSAAAAAMIAAAVRMWRREWPAGENLFWWPYDRATARGWVRATAVFAAFISFLPASVILIRVTDVRPPVPLWESALWFGAFTLIIGLMVTVVFFNWPKFVVPPRMRGEPGAVAEWRRWRREKRERAREGTSTTRHA